MLAQLLNRDFILDMVRGSERELRRITANREAGLITGPPTELDDVSTEELLRLADLLAQSAHREELAKPSVGPPAQVGEEPPPRRTTTPTCPASLCSDCFKAHWKLR